KAGDSFTFYKTDNTTVIENLTVASATKSSTGNLTVTFTTTPTPLPTSSTGAITAVANDNNETSTATIVTNTFNDLEASLIAGGTMHTWIQNDVNEAHKYDLPLVAYEGDGGLLGGNFTVIATANADPRMYTITQ